MIQKIAFLMIVSSPCLMAGESTPMHIVSGTSGIILILMAISNFPKNK